VAVADKEAKRTTPCVVHDGLAVYRIGSGDPILLMPGPHRFQIPGDGSANPLIEGLNAIGRQVISFDPPQSGRSTRPAHLSMQEMHQCADEALDHSEITGPVDAIGHSMGGLTVLAYALERPERVRRLILAGTGSGGPAYMNAPGALWNRDHPGFWPMAALAMLHIVWPRLGPEIIMNNFIRRQSFHDPAQVRRKPVKVGDWFRPRQGRSDWHRIARKLDYAPRIGDLAAPTLVLCGRHDPQYPLSCSQALAAGIPHAELSVFEHSGHYPFIEEAAIFWATVDNFLSQN
jgi:proline iminopeptidase